MININTIASPLARKWKQRAAALEAAKRRGLRNAAVAVDNEQVNNLSGSGADAAGAYPVPVRTGNLRRGHFFEARLSSFAIVGNTTEYAMAVHKDRPFLDDAAAAVDVVEIMAVPVRKAVLS